MKIARIFTVNKAPGSSKKGTIVFFAPPPPKEETKDCSASTLTQQAEPENRNGRLDAAATPPAETSSVSGAFLVQGRLGFGDGQLVSALARRGQDLLADILVCFLEAKIMLDIGENSYLAFFMFINLGL